MVIIGYSQYVTGGIMGEINLKLNQHSFFKAEIRKFKTTLREALSYFRTDPESLALDSPTIYSDQASIPFGVFLPANFFDAGTIDEIGRGSSYAFFEELKQCIKEGRKISLFDIKKSFAQRGVLDNELQDRFLNLTSQTRAALAYGLHTPLTTYIYEKTGILLLPNNDNIRLEADVINADEIELRIVIPLDTITKKSPVTVSESSWCFRITRTDIIIDRLNYKEVRTNNPEAKAIGAKVFKAIKSDCAQESIFTKMMELLIKLFSSPEKKPAHVSEDDSENLFKLVP